MDKITRRIQRAQDYARGPVKPKPDPLAAAGAMPEPPLMGWEAMSGDVTWTTWTTETRTVHPEQLVRYPVHDLAGVQRLPPNMLTEVDISGFSIRKLRWRVEDPWWAGDQVRVVCFMNVPDRTRGEWTEVHHEKLIPKPTWQTYSAMSKGALVRTLFRELLLHELDEQLLVNGQRMFDPHKAIQP